MKRAVVTGDGLLNQTSEDCFLCSAEYRLLYIARLHNSFQEFVTIVWQKTFVKTMLILYHFGWRQLHSEDSVVLKNRLLWLIFTMFAHWDNIILHKNMIHVKGRTATIKGEIKLVVSSFLILNAIRTGRDGNIWLVDKSLKQLIQLRSVFLLLQQISHRLKTQAWISDYVMPPTSRLPVQSSAKSIYLKVLL